MVETRQPAELSAGPPDRAARPRRAPLALLLLLVLAEALAAAAVWALRPAPAGQAALLTASGMLALGLAPALLRPSWLSARLAALQVLLAALIWHAGALPPPAPLSLTALAALLPDPRAALILLNGALALPLTLHIVARFPRRSAVPGWLLAAAYASFGGAAAAAILAPAGWRVALLALLAAGVYGVFAVAGWLLVWAIRDPRPAGRQQLAQARLLFVGLLMAVAPVLALPAARLVGGAVPPALLLAVQICFPAAVLFALLRRDLLGIDVALRRALGYAATSVGLLALYFGLTLGLAALLRDLSPASAQFSAVLGVLGAASAFPWLQGRAARLITRAFYPERLAFQRELAAAQERLGGVVRRDEVATLLMAELPARLGAERAWLQLLPDPPPPEGFAWSAPLTVGGRQLGVYWLGPRRTGLPYAPDELAALRGLVQQAALALAYAESYEALAALNSELEARVAARTEQLLAHQRELAAVAERQRLARDLHDSLKQTLFSLGLNLHAAAGLAPRDPERARALIAQQAERVVQAQSDLADLLSDLRAEPGDAADLVAALRREAAELEAQHGFPVALDAPPALEVGAPATRELTAVAREALHNALKHSGARGASLHVAAETGEIVVVVADKGRGFDLAGPSPAGHGLRGMRERVAALGGALTIAAAPGAGTTVRASVPAATRPLP